MKKAINIKVLAVLIGTMVSVSLIGCASMHQSSKWGPFGLDSKEEGTVRVRPSRKTAESYYKIGLFYQERRNYAMAAESFRDAVFIDSLFFEAYNNLGICYDQMKMYEKAVTAYQNAISLYPDRDEVHNNMGYSQLLQGDFDAAIKSFSTAISLNQANNRRYYNNLGLAYTKKGLYAEAYRAFVVAGGEEKARRNIATLAPSPKVAQEVLSVSKQGAETNYPPGRDGLPAHNDVVTENTAPQQLEPGEELLTSSQLEQQQPEPFVVSLDDPKRHDVAVASVAPVEVGMSVQESLAQPVEQNVVVTVPAALDKLAPAAITLEQVSSLMIDGESSQQIPMCSLSPQDNVEITLPIVNKDSVAVATVDSPKVASRSVAMEPFIIELARSPVNAAVTANMGHFLSEKGFVVQMRPHKSKYYGKTIIYYRKGSFEEAYQLAQSIPGYQILKQEKFGLSTSRLRVVLGEDMMPYFRKRFVDISAEQKKQNRIGERKELT